MDGGQTTIATVEVLQVGLVGEIAVSQFRDGIVRRIQPLQRLRQIGRHLRQVVAADVEQLQMRRVPEGQVGHVVDFVGGEMHFFQVVAPG